MVKWEKVCMLYLIFPKFDPWNYKISTFFGQTRVMYMLKVDWLFYSQSTCTLPTSLDTMTCLEMLGSGPRTTSMDWTVTAATGIMTTSPPPALMVDITLFWWALENTCTWFYLRRVKAFRKSVRLPWFYCRCLIFH